MDMILLLSLDISFHLWIRTSFQLL